MPSTPVHNSFPPIAASPSVTDTPTKSKNVVSAPVICSKKVAEGREAVVQDVGSAVPQVPIQWFKDYLLPPLPPNLDLHAVVKHLKDHHQITTSGTWKDFTTTPFESMKVEDVVFAPLETIAGEIGKAAKVVLSTLPEPTVEFQCRPASTPKSLRRNNASRPDGYGLYVRHPSYQKHVGRVFWENIVAPWEVKKKNRVEDINDNIAKILWSFHHIMREDDSRRFTIGYTIENTDMRLWFGSRTDALVSDPFDFTRVSDASSPSPFVASY
ncbi:hypothetical protein BDY19DRAFT_1022001 [Irpex rosettiformis]|uniref:Uncharacterized protein n=1 Tax=Irpex rosettiformis TaxID=378272 RepID=A0ACB8TSX7_9APHY|nr:hypothetical protein BDY19DRAFT_1022001 [Irpex rosettiformis]